MFCLSFCAKINSNRHCSGWCICVFIFFSCRTHYSHRNRTVIFYGNIDSTFFCFLFSSSPTARKRKGLAHILHVPTAFRGRFRVQRQHAGHAFIPSVCEGLRDHFCEITSRRGPSTWFRFLDLGEYNTLTQKLKVYTIPLSPYTDWTIRVWCFRIRFNYVKIFEQFLFIIFLIELPVKCSVDQHKGHLYLGTQWNDLMFPTVGYGKIGRWDHPPVGHGPTTWDTVIVK